MSLVSAARWPAWDDDLKPRHQIDLLCMCAEPTECVNRRLHGDPLSKNLEAGKIVATILLLCAGSGVVMTRTSDWR